MSYLSDWERFKGMADALYRSAIYVPITPKVVRSFDSQGKIIMPFTFTYVAKSKVKGEKEKAPQIVAGALQRAALVVHHAAVITIFPDAVSYRMFRQKEEEDERMETARSLEMDRQASTTREIGYAEDRDRGRGML